MPIQFAPNEVHLWNLCTDVDAATLAALHATLSDAEQAHAKQYHFEHDTRRYIARRGLIRATLAQYLTIAPQALTFDLGTHGKPLLAPACTADTLHFNYSYSEQALLLAVSDSYELGVDIETPRQVLEAQAIAQQNFSVTEQQVLAGLDYVSDVFFTCWTAKEAVIKALGSGLSRPLHDFTTLTDTGSLQHELQVHDYDRGQLQRIRLRAVPAPHSLHATLAVLLPTAAVEPIMVVHRQ